MDSTALMSRVPEFIATFRQERLSRLRPVNEFFDMQRISRPSDVGVATTRINYNTKFFSGNYIAIFLMLALYSLLTNPLLLIAIAFLGGGFLAITKYITEPVQFGQTVITPKNLYTVLFLIGIPILWVAAPISTFFWLVGSSSVIILSHAVLLEPGLESEYGSVQGV